MALKRWMRIIGRVGLAVLALTLGAPSVQAASTTLYVGTCKGASPYTTIQSAVDAVNGEWFTIYVCPGTYNESVQVNNKRFLTIRSYAVKNQPLPLIDAGGTNGVSITNSKGVKIRDLRLTNAAIAIRAGNSPETQVFNTFINASTYGIVFETGSNKSEAQQNTMSGQGGDNSYGIALGDTADITILLNTISSFDYGIYASNATHPILLYNRLSDVRNTGIALEGVSRGTVRQNTTNFASYGITMQGSTAGTISENTAKGNSQAGVYVTSSTTGNTFAKNVLQGNGTDAFDESTGSKTSGTANTWTSNKCDTSVPGDLCASPATQRRAPPAPPTFPSWPFHR